MNLYFVVEIWQKKKSVSTSDLPEKVIMMLISNPITCQIRTFSVISKHSIPPPLIFVAPTGALDFAHIVARKPPSPAAEGPFPPAAFFLPSHIDYVSFVEGELILVGLLEVKPRLHQQLLSTVFWHVLMEKGVLPSARTFIFETFTSQFEPNMTMIWSRLFLNITPCFPVFSTSLTIIGFAFLLLLVIPLFGSPLQCVFDSFILYKSNKTRILQMHSYTLVSPERGKTDNVCKLCNYGVMYRQEKRNV